MMEDDKPFACPSFDCGMRFANEDHLSVHKQKHEMSLTLTSSVNLKTSFVDQTPTPTRFLSTLTALESELFQEFPNYNPFEATFRKENSKGTNSNQLTVPEASTLISSLPESDVLNTPSITLTSEVENAVFTKQRAISNVQAVDVSDDTLPFTPSTQMPSGTDLDDLASNNNSNTVVSENCDTGVEAMSSTHSTVSTTATTFLDAGKSDPIKASGVQTPVITSVGLPGSVKSSVTSVPMAVVVTKAVTSSVSALSTAVRPISVVSESPSPAKVIDITPPVLPSISVAPVVQLIIRLPDGQSMPFQIPVSIAPAPPVNVQPIKVATNTPSSKTSTSTTQSLTKMKLREVLTLSRKSSNGVNGNTPNNIDMEVGNSYPSFIAPCQNSSDAGSINDSPPPSPQASHRSGSTGGRRRDSEGDPDEKRRKSLERNRAAAIRCREKRKQWIVALEKKAEELAHTNVQLQNEVSMLRSEVSQLKSMLLAHKDCPITLQQKASSFCGVTNSHTVPIHIKRSQSPAAQVAERTRLTSVPIQVEVMDVEVNSSGSGFLLEVSDSSSVSEPRTPAQGKFHEAF